MSGSINKVILIGNLGKDPEIRAMQDGKEIANLTIATSENWKDKATGERKEKTEWHRVVIFNENLVRVAKEYLKKGSKLYLEGSIVTRKWTNKEGVDQYSTEVVLQNFNGTLVLLSKKEESQSGYEVAKGSDYAQQESVSVADNELNDSIPF